MSHCAVKSTECGRCDRLGLRLEKIASAASQEGSQQLWNLARDCERSPTAELLRGSIGPARPGLLTRATPQNKALVALARRCVIGTRLAVQQQPLDSSQADERLRRGAEV